MNLINNKIERAKTNLYIKCRSLVSGLHVLADNRIPESILHVDTLANILLAVRNKLQHDNRYSLLYGSEVNAYYHIPLVRSFIINDVLFMTVMLSLRCSDAPILSIYSLESHYLPTNMYDDKKATGSYTCLQIDHKYIAANRNQFCILDDDLTHTTLQHDHLHVPTKPLLLFKRLVPNCYIAILNHAPAKVITDTCKSRYYQHIVVPTSLVSRPLLPTKCKH